MLVTGPNEAARVALFRATAGISSHGEGCISRPPLDKILFLPQQPYLTPGTLRDQLIRTGRERDVPDERILAAIHDAGLDSVVQRAGGLDIEHDWPAILSLGEQQQLAVIRLILARPSFALLDRVSTALGPAMLERSLQRLTASSITLHQFRPGCRVRACRALRRGATDQRQRRLELEPARAGRSTCSFPLATADDQRLARLDLPQGMAQTQNRHQCQCCEGLLGHSDGLAELANAEGEEGHADGGDREELRPDGLDPRARKMMAWEKPTKWREGSNSVRRCIHRGWLSTGVLPPERSCRTMMTRMIRSANWAIDREMVPR